MQEETIKMSAYLLSNTCKDLFLWSMKNACNVSSGLYLGKKFDNLGAHAENSFTDWRMPWKNI